MSRIGSRIAVLLATAAALCAQPARRPLKIEDMHRFHDVRDPQISPDGKWVAYTVSTVDTAADKSDTDVWMTSWDGKQHLRMTSSTEGESAPRWSPDGQLAGVPFEPARQGARATRSGCWTATAARRSSSPT